MDSMHILFISNNNKEKEAINWRGNGVALKVVGGKGHGRVCREEREGRSDTIIFQLKFQ